MRRSNPVRSAAALSLLVLLGALGTGMPSHHHGDAEVASSEVRLISADHHAHGTELVEQSDRAPSLRPQFAAPAATDAEPLAASASFIESMEPQLARPKERAPPPGAPRAPPLPV